jgi:hypothetical protein
MDEEELSAALKETIDRHFAEVRRIFAECARDLDRRFDEIEAHLKKMDWGTWTTWRSTSPSCRRV